MRKKILNLLTNFFMLVFYIDMDVKNINNFNSLYIKPNTAFKNFTPHLDILKQNSLYNNKKECKNNENTVKIGVTSVAILATLGVLYGITRKKGVNPFKNFNMFKQEIEPLDMLKITGVTVPASLITGILLDKNKENTKPKIREGISQMVGNLLIPILLIDKVCKFKDSLNGKTFKNTIMKTLSKTHKSIYVGVTLVGGLMIGNKVSNFVNSIIFPEHKQRPLKTKDFAVHFDDICFATSLIFKGNKLGNFANRLIPATLLLSAYETGTKTKKDE